MAPKVACVEAFEAPMKDNNVGGSDAKIGGERSCISVPKMSISDPAKVSILPNNLVRELLECSVCMSSMYPPIHQVLNHDYAFFFLSNKKKKILHMFVYS